MSKLGGVRYVMYHWYQDGEPWIIARASHTDGTPDGLARWLFLQRVYFSAISNPDYQRRHPWQSHRWYRIYIKGCVRVWSLFHRG